MPKHQSTWRDPVVTFKADTPVADIAGYCVVMDKLHTEVVRLREIWTDEHGRTSIRFETLDVPEEDFNNIAVTMLETARGFSRDKEGPGGIDSVITLGEQKWSRKTSYHAHQDDNEVWSIFCGDQLLFYLKNSTFSYVNDLMRRMNEANKTKKAGS